MASPHEIEVLRTPFGRYMWWPAIQILRYHQKGNRKHDREWVLSGRQNHVVRVIRKAATLERDRTFRESQTWV